MLRCAVRLSALLMLAALAACGGAARVEGADLVREALVAEGASSAESDVILRQWRDVVREAGVRGLQRDRRQLAALALELVYERVTTGRYIADCTSLRRAFREGVYNCVSITILYQSLCDELGLPTVTLARPGHVLCQVWLGEGPAGSAGDKRWVKVETTCRAWFQGTGRPAAASGSGPLRPLAPSELVAKIYYNRGVELLHRQDYEAAVAITELAWQLDPADDRARDNHLAALNNGAIALIAARRYEEAKTWLARAREIDPHYALLPRNEAFLQQSWAADRAIQ